jgi:oligopeptide/dipeptide ABC transporter ATP-binding protein
MTATAPVSAAPAATARTGLLAEDLTIQFRDGRGATVTAVDGVTLGVAPGEVVGLVGESGCGKSTLARTLVGLNVPARGRVLRDGVDVSAARGRELRQHRRIVQYIYQDPYASLSPRHTIRQALTEALVIRGVPRQAQAAELSELLDMVGLPSSCLDRRPSGLSGGQRQRVAIARALAMKPQYLVCDEPVSALDVSIRAQVMNLLLDLQRELGLGYLFIAHDLGLVRRVADRVAVMYLGRIVEHGPADVVYADPRHPYTRSLLEAIPDTDPDVQRARGFRILPGELPSPAAPPPGCRFHTRCPMAAELCSRVDPPRVDMGDARTSACHFAADLPVGSGFLREGHA